MINLTELQKRTKFLSMSASLPKAIAFASILTTSLKAKRNLTAISHVAVTSTQPPRTHTARPVVRSPKSICTIGT